jgi:organic radical activating enzyme
MIDSLWPASYAPSKYVVFTGGEPLLQLDAALIEAMHAVGFDHRHRDQRHLAVPDGVDWICVSPKMGSELKVLRGSELKVVVPQVASRWRSIAGFQHFLLQAMDGPQAAAIPPGHRDGRHNPKWKLSIQTHKLLNP